MLEFLLSQNKKANEQKKEIIEDKVTTKLIIKNLAFQTNKEELQQLFKELVKFRKLRFPQKLDGTCRGFAFLEFDTEEECKQAKAVIMNLHFYGRKLVIEYAEN